jgi:hypothetical protein
MPTNPSAFRHPRYQLLTAGTSQPKMTKPAPGDEPWANVILHLAPADASGVTNVCPWAGSCKAVCLNTAGRGVMNTVQAARIRRTKLYVSNHAGFMDDLMDDLVRFANACWKRGYRPAARLNGTSDIAWWTQRSATGTNVFELLPDVQFYDYTKRPPSLWPDLPDNYHLTYSHDPENDFDHCLDAWNRGTNVAMVFDVKKSDPLPATYGGIPVIDGRTHDYRFLDPTGPLIVGLSALGAAKGSAFALTPTGAAA